MRQHEFSDSINCLLPFGQQFGEYVPHVDHFGPHFQGDIDARGFGTFCDTGRVIEQNFGVADVNQQRRQPAQIGIKRREPWRLQIG